MTSTEIFKIFLESVQDKIFDLYNSIPSNNLYLEQLLSRWNREHFLTI